jgi:hypothetical protein
VCIPGVTFLEQCHLPEPVLQTGPQDVSSLVMRNVTDDMYKPQTLQHYPRRYSKIIHTKSVQKGICIPRLAEAQVLMTRIQTEQKDQKEQRSTSNSSESRRQRSSGKNGKNSTP